MTLLYVCCLTAATLIAARNKSGTDVNITPEEPTQGGFIADGDTLNTKGGFNDRSMDVRFWHPLTPFLTSRLQCTNSHLMIL